MSYQVYVYVYDKTISVTVLYWKIIKQQKCTTDQWNDKYNLNDWLT